MSEASSIPDHALREVLAMLQGLFSCGDYADAKVTCGGGAWPIHSLIVCPRSTFFKGALRSGFKESRSKVVDLPEDNRWAVFRMVKYFYSLDYTEDLATELTMGGIMKRHTEDRSEYVSRLNINVVMYAMGDKYGIKSLKKLAENKFEAAHEAISGTPIEARELMVIIPTVYESTPETDRGLRDSVLSYASNAWSNISALPGFKDLFTRTPAFTTDLFSKVPKNIILEQCSSCGCGDEWKAESIRCVCGTVKKLT